MKIVEVIKRIDNGGFGIVDSVRCEDGNIYARKTFSINFPHNEDLKENALNRFKREATYQESFSHRNIVPILYKELEIEVPYYIMPLADKSLKDITFANKEDIVRMLLDVMSGLEEMHKKSFYHRDLKPGNILKFIDDQGDYYYAIGDFGLLSINQTNITELTPLLMKKGTDYYTAPEIVESLTRASIQSDIFSFGCLLHDYFGKSSRIPTQPINEDGAIGKIIANCTHKKPHRRFNSIELLREAFISISHDDIETKTPEGKKLVALLESNSEIGIDEWENVIDFLSNDKNNSDDVSNIFKLINIQRINELIKLNIALADSYGLLFSDWVRETNFIFDFCDIIGNRLDLLVESCGINVKTQCIMALLFMGTSHNRFYVEDICYRRMSTKVDDTLAERIAIEIISEGKTICYKINHLEHSIRINRANFHPKIAEAVNKLCKK